MLNARLCLAIGLLLLSGVALADPVPKAMLGEWGYAPVCTGDKPDVVLRENDFETLGSYTTVLKVDATRLPDGSIKLTIVGVAPVAQPWLVPGDSMTFRMTNTGMEGVRQVTAGTSTFWGQNFVRCTGGAPAASGTAVPEPFLGRWGETAACGSDELVVSLDQGLLRMTQPDSSYRMSVSASAAPGGTRLTATSVTLLSGRPGLFVAGDSLVVARAEAGLKLLALDSVREVRDTSSFPALVRCQ